MVVLNIKVYIYRFSDLKLIDQISTVCNPKGLISLCPDPSNNVLAIPGKSLIFYGINKFIFIKNAFSLFFLFILFIF